MIVLMKLELNNSEFNIANGCKQLIEKVFKLYGASETKKELAARLGINVLTLYRVCCLWDIEMPVRTKTKTNAVS